MKKAFLLIALIGLTLTSYAQEVAAPYYGFRLGLTAHPTFGYIKPENGKGNGVSLGFSYGLMADFNFAENYSFATGLTVTTINGKSTEINPAHYHPQSNQNLLAYDLKYKMQYIEVPITIKLKTNKFGAVRWYGQFGLSTNFAIGSKQDASQGNTILANDVNSADLTNFFRAGLIAGGGLEYSIDQKTSLVTGVTLNNGFTNISSGNKLGADNKVKNHYVGLNIGVFF